MHEGISLAATCNSDQLEAGETYSVQHLQHSILLAGIQPVDDDHQPRLVLSEAINGFGHPGHQLHLALENLCKRQTGSTEDRRKLGTLRKEPTEVT